MRRSASRIDWSVPFGVGVRLLARSLRFYVRHMGPILGLALLTAVGRVIQIGWAYESALALALLLELGVALARVGIFLIVVGHGRLGDGIAAVRLALRRSRSEAEEQLAPVRAHSRQLWPAMLVSIVIYGVFALLVNLAIRTVAGTAPLLDLAREVGFPEGDDGALRNEVVFFMKNLTIIPFTLVWMVEGLHRTLREGDLR